MKRLRDCARIGPAILVAFLLSPAICMAHDLYFAPVSFAPKPGSVTHIRLHNGDSFPASDGPPVFERIRDAAMISSLGGAPLRLLHREGDAGAAEYTAPRGSHILALRTTPNFLGLDPTQFEGYLNHEKLNWVIRWRVDHREFAKDGRELYSKFAKALIGLEHDDYALKPVGHTAEILLLANPAKKHVGETVPVQILFRGKPVESQSLEIAWSHNGKTERRWIGETDAEGKIDVKLESAGVWKLHTVIMERRPDTTEADWASFWASLTFAVGPVP